MTIEQGIRYELRAMVAPLAVLEPVAVACPDARLVALEQGLALIPVTAALASCLTGLDPVPPETGFRALTPGLQDMLRTTSYAGRVGYLEADYLGRDGRQTAAVWHYGLIVCGPHILGVHESFPATGGGPIGAALRCLGTITTGRRDEFMTSGLNRRRRTEDWA
jgi:hypothetical protein